MKIIMGIVLFLLLKHENAKAQEEIINRDTFYNVKKEIQYIFYTEWVINQELAPVSPQIDTLRIVSLLDSFFYNIVEKEVLSIIQKMRIRITINTIRFPVDRNLFYGINILVNGKDKTAAEDFWLFRSYSKDVKWNKIYDEVWFLNEYLNAWLNKWYTALKKKLQRKKLFSG